jgi:septal ring factor EnvC (AmiA/AmiB activator)
MSIFDFNEGERNVVTATAKLSAISVIAGIAMALGGYGVLHIGEKADDKHKLEREVENLKEQLDSAKDRAAKYQTMYAESDRGTADALRRLIQLQFENQKLRAQIDSIEKAKTNEGLGD